MQSFASLTVLLFLALSSVIASPVEKRASISCESTPITTRRITTSNTDPNAMYPTVFSLGNTTTQDHYGTKAKVLISTKDDGTPFTIRTDPQSLNFDFIVCNSTYMNTKPSGSAYTELVYGILRPAGQTQHCIQAKTGSVETPDQVFTNSKCSYNEDSSQLGQTFSYFPNDGSLKFISTRLGANQHQHPTFLTRSSVGHNALKLNAGSGSGITLSMAPGA